MAKSALKWIGGKHKNASKYVELLPESFYTMLSPFCGALHVELKIKAKNYIINDKNNDLTNFLEVLRTRRSELYKACKLLGYSESLFDKFTWEETPEDCLERAMRFFYIVRAGFGGGGHKYKNGFSVSCTLNKPQTYMSAVKDLIAMGNQIRGWVIINKDFQVAIERYSTKDTFRFCDPPYVGCEDLYAGGFTEQDHYRLKECLENTPGNAMVCYYDHPLVRELYEGWNIVEYTTKSKIQRFDYGEKCPTRTELIIMNYNPPAGQISMIG